MKTKLINIVACTALIIGAISCKGEKKNETEATAAEEVIEAPAAAITYTVDNAASSIAWIGKKPTGQHTGTISVSKGKVKTQDVTDLEGDQKAGLEGHLKGEGEGKEDHFFNVAKFPNASFEVTGISEKDGKSMVEGNLTIKGIKKNVSFPASTSIDGDAMILTSEVFTINRTEWGVNYGSKSIFENLGDKFINDDIELKVSLKANKA